MFLSQACDPIHFRLPAAIRKADRPGWLSTHTHTRANMGSTPFPGLCTSCMLHMENVAISRARCTCVIDSAWDKKKKKKEREREKRTVRVSLQWNNAGNSSRNTGGLV